MRGFAIALALTLVLATFSCLVAPGPPPEDSASSTDAAPPPPSPLAGFLFSVAGGFALLAFACLVCRAWRALTKKYSTPQGAPIEVIESTVEIDMPAKKAAPEFADYVPCSAVEK